MCHGNLAQASTRFINAQLSALWENSKACNDKAGQGKKPEDLTIEHGIAMCEFYGAKSKTGETAAFHAVFEAPRMEFLCNHELILFLQIVDGQYEVKGSTLAFPKITLAIRLLYQVTNLSATLNDGNCVISVITINPSSARTIPELSTTTTSDFGQLSQLLKDDYLPVLLQTGHLNLFVLPPSYTGEREIDHAVLANRIVPNSLLLGVQVDKINEVLGHHWLAAIDHPDDNKSAPMDVQDIYLAEYRTPWLDGDLWANYKFNPLKIQVLCEKEIVLFFTADIRLYFDKEETDFDSELKDWKLAVIFQVVRDHDGRIILDESHAPRIAPSLSVLQCPPQEDSLDEKFRYSFKDSILHEYIGLMFKFGHSQLYPDFSSGRNPSEPIIPPCPSGGRCRADPHCPCGGRPSVSGPKPEPHAWPSPRPDHPVGPYCPGGSDFTIDWALLRRLFVKETSLHGYHHVTSVTQAGINAHFVAVWTKAKAVVAAPSPSHKNIDKRLDILTHFDSKEYPDGQAAYLPQFTCEFGAPQVELITTTGSTSVIVYFYVKKISFSLDNKTNEFKDWVLAFKFNLKMVSGSPDKKSMAAIGVAELRQLILDPNTAVLLHDRSTFVGLVDTQEPNVTRALYGNLSTNFSERYIKTFVEKGHHVLYAFPIHSREHVASKPNAHHRAHAVTDISFSIVPFSLSNFNGRTFQGLWGPLHHIVERNMIVFHGVTGKTSLGDTALLPGPYGPPSIHPPHGTLLLARESFLEAHIIKPLAKVNALSTVLCNFSGVDKSHWDLTLQTWKEHPMKLDSGDDCQWEQDERGDNGLQYKWENSEEWKYEAEGKGTRVRTYSVIAKTHNRLVIPTMTSSGPLTMLLEGRCSIQLEFGVHKLTHWTGTLEATWEAPISLVSDSQNGLSVNAPKQVKVDFRKDSVNHTSAAYDISKDALDAADGRLRAAFGSPIDISTVIEGVHKSFSGVYQGLIPQHTQLVLSSPVFTSEGHLLMQLLARTPVQPAVGTKDVPGQVSPPVKTDSSVNESIRKRKAQRAAAAPGSSVPSGPPPPIITILPTTTTRPTSSALTPTSETLVANTPVPVLPSTPSPASKPTNGYLVNGNGGAYGEHNEPSPLENGDARRAFEKRGKRDDGVVPSKLNGAVTNEASQPDVPVTQD